MPSVEIVMAEFGPSRANNGDAKLPTDRLEPTLSSFTKWFPEATVKVFTDQDWLSTDRYEVVKVDPPFDRKHSRWGNRCNDLYDAVGLLESKADIAIALDSDLLIVNENVRSILALTERYGLCMPVNGRHLMHRDARSDCDGGPVNDETCKGFGMCHCTAFWAFRTGHTMQRQLLQYYCGQIVDDAKQNQGARGPLSLYRATIGTGLFPYTLPSHWCVTGSNLWVQPEHAICLHVGHDSVKEHYKSLVEKYQ